MDILATLRQVFVLPFVKGIFLNIALNALFSFEEKLDFLEEGGGDGVRGLSQQDVLWIGQEHAHHGGFARWVGTAGAVGAVRKAIYRGAEGLMLIREP